MKRLIVIILTTILALSPAMGAVLALTQPTVTLSNNDISGTANYTILFTIGEDVAEGEDIIIEFPEGTDIASITNAVDGDVTIAATSGIGSTAFSATQAGSAIDEQELTITIPDVNAQDLIGSGATVQVIVSGVGNPDDPDDYTLDVSTLTSADTVIESAVTSDSYAIEGPTLPSTPSVKIENVSVPSVVTVG